MWSTLSTKCTNRIFLLCGRTDIARDGVDWSEKIYTQAVEAVEGNLDEQGKSMLGVPISALYGDNILEPSAKTPWFVSGSSSPAVLVDAIDRAVMGSLGDQNMEAKW